MNTNKEINMESIEQAIRERVSSAFDDSVDNAPTTPDVTNPQYQTIEEYKQATGRRFRITKEEQELGLSREEAFRRRIERGELNG